MLMELTSILYPVLSIGGLGLLFGAGLGFSAKKFMVESDPKVGMVRDVLPGANCAGCGYAGCDAFAQAVVEGEAKVTGCPVGGAAVAEKIAEILGIEVGSMEKQVAFIKCNGTCDKAKVNYEYFGLRDCRAEAQLAAGGNKSCQYGCLGLGSCKQVCPFDAISIKDDIAVIDTEKCTSCGKCVETCPKMLIEIIPAKSDVRVVCNSRAPGKEVRSKCSVGCIACKMCVKACAYDAIHVENNIAHVDYNKCTQCMECVKKCPTHCILGS